MQIVLYAQALASGMMCGVIWFVQLVHYPLFASLPDDGGPAYCREHRRLTPRVVLPPMLVEGIAAGLLAIAPPATIGRGPTILGAVLVAAAWVSTAAVQMPLHARLGQPAREAGLVPRLVRTNWLRTGIWTARAAIALWMLRTG
ncbi:MAG: hypothetical protein ACK5SI_14095 [Planctomycetia bacterium]|jgi:hypothetical protein